MSYTFLPWLLEGAAAELTAAGDGTNRVRATLQLVINQTVIDPLAVRLLGPGDVLGFDQRQVVRTEPPDLAGGVEPNYFPFVEFDRPSFPWLFTPAGPDAGNRLRPWLSLVVVRRQDGVWVEPHPTTKVPMLTIASPAVPGDELPDLGEAWAWAHVQVTAKASGDELARVLESEPARSVSRLLCPRRLAPATAYLACVVPAFAAGVAAALGQPVDDRGALQDAWKLTDPRVQLPVYYRWEFTTGASGDFESLAAALHGDETPTGVGRRGLDIGDPGFGLVAGDGSRVEFEGALRVPGDPPDDGPAWFRAAMAEMLRAGDHQVVRPPLYGGIQAQTGELPSAGWLHELNVEPRHRAAAGLGARVVREQQERFVEAASAQAGELDAANRFLARSQLARSVGESVWAQRLTPLADQAPEELLRVAAPARLPQGNLRLRIRSSSLPDTILDPAFRRLTRPRGPLARRFADDPGPTDPPSTDAVDPHQVVADLEPGAAHRVRVAQQLRAPVEMGVMDRSDPLAAIVRAPTFPAPMSVELQRLAVDYLLPGIEHLPDDTALVLVPNRPFVAAFLAGLNHELSRELLWREYPTHLAATFSRVFWDRRGQALPDASTDELADIDDIGAWGLGEALGDRVRTDPDGELVLVVRGQLLLRYPRAVVSAVKAAPGPDGRRVLADPAAPGASERPLFTGFIEPDTCFFGFGMGVAAARGDDDGLGWFFVVQEQPFEPRFGLDEASRQQSVDGWLPDPPAADGGQGPPALATAELAWGHLVAREQFQRLSHAPVLRARPAGQPPDRPPWRFTDRQDLSWTGGSADLAALTLQRPARVAIHAERLLPPRPQP
jgi:hypothetical protein